MFIFLLELIATTSATSTANEKRTDIRKRQTKMIDIRSSMVSKPPVTSEKKSIKSAKVLGGIGGVILGKYITVLLLYLKNHKKGGS